MSETPRRLWALVNGLPPDAAVRRQGSAWSQDHELHAIAIERNDYWLHALVVASRGLKKNPPRLPPIEHPDRNRTRDEPSGERPEVKQRMSTPEEIRAFFGRLQGG
ncbi:MAG: hypothetical protein QOD51_2235 [Candidatus Eremiobacteraeota bacterium]|nr:hypothetical protein [Candidatus Eremiobacteraeota bacterium]